jgi:hypothetical protein
MYAYEVVGYVLSGFIGLIISVSVILYFIEKGDK